MVFYKKQLEIIHDSGAREIIFCACGEYCIENLGIFHEAVDVVNSLKQAESIGWLEISGHLINKQHDRYYRVCPACYKKLVSDKETDIINWLEGRDIYIEKKENLDGEEYTIYDKVAHGDNLRHYVKQKLKNN